MDGSNTAVLQVYLQTAEAAARAAGAVIREAFAKPRGEVMQKSNATDLVTETDQKAETIIKAMLHAAHPDHLYGEA
jgi:myo-inositol-1(or 4)-monophosphatase